MRSEVLSGAERWQEVTQSTREKNNVDQLKLISLRLKSINIAQGTSAFTCFLICRQVHLVMGNCCLAFPKISSAPERKVFILIV